MDEHYWKLVSLKEVPSTVSNTTFSVHTFEHELPHGKLVMISTGYGKGRSNSVVFVPNPLQEDHTDDA